MIYHARPLEFLEAVELIEAIVATTMCKRQAAEGVADEMLKEDRVSRRCEIRTVGAYAFAGKTARRSVLRSPAADGQTIHVVT
jgi:hypothetical protein